MKKPCKIVGLEMLEDNEEKVSLYFTELKSYGDIVIHREKHKILFNQVCDYMKTGETFDFMLMDLTKDSEKTQEKKE